MSANISAVTDDTFEAEVLESNIPVIVDFWAPWCGPCKALAPLLEDLAPQYAGKMKVVKLDVDSNPSTPPKLGVRGIPTLMVFKDGQVVATHVGLVSKPDLAKFFDTHSQ